MSYKFIKDPITSNVYSIHSELGRNLIKSYIAQIGGADENLETLGTEEIMGDNDALIKAGEIKKEAEAEAKKAETETQETLNQVNAKTEDKLWSRFKSQWLPWIGDRFKDLGELFNSVSETPQNIEQTGGNGAYIRNVLSFIV